MPMTPKEVIKLLLANGFEQAGFNGSHRKFVNKKTKRTVIAPYHNQSLKPGTEHNVLKQAGLK